MPSNCKHYCRQRGDVASEILRDEGILRALTLTFFLDHQDEGLHRMNKYWRSESSETTHVSSPLIILRFRLFTNLLHTNKTAVFLSLAAFVFFFLYFMSTTSLFQGSKKTQKKGWGRRRERKRYRELQEITGRPGKNVLSNLVYSSPGLPHCFAYWTHWRQHTLLA